MVVSFNGRGLCAAVSFFRLMRLLNYYSNSPLFTNRAVYSPRFGGFFDWNQITLYTLRISQIPYISQQNFTQKGLVGSSLLV